MKDTKLVPIRKALAESCQDEALRTRTGYYETVNRRVETQPQLLEVLGKLLEETKASRDVHCTTWAAANKIYEQAKGATK
jgi:hypothetical protein